METKVTQMKGMRGFVCRQKFQQIKGFNKFLEDVKQINECYLLKQSRGSHSWKHTMQLTVW